MATLTEVTVPDIGDFDEIPVIEILVSPGDTVSAETPLITLESDKATMDVPAPTGGVVRELKVAIGDNVSQGTLILLLDTNSAAEDNAAADNETHTAADASGQDAAQADLTTQRQESEPAPTPPAPVPVAAQSTIEIAVPDIGDFNDIPVIELLVNVGDSVDAETPLVTLESDKATMDVPSPQAGTITALKVAVGDTVSQGSIIALLDTVAFATDTQTATQATGDANVATAQTAAVAGQPEAVAAATDAPVRSSTRDDNPPPAPESQAGLRPAPTAGMEESAPSAPSHATPAVRRFARELNVDIGRVSGSGRKGRILRSDIVAFVKQALSAQPHDAAHSASITSSTARGIEPIPAVDFSRFGPVEEQQLSRIKRISGPFLQRAWLNIPHVTNHDEVDITEMEAFRKSLADEAKRRGVRVTALAFIMKALANSLATFPSFNSSLSPDGTSLILKKYFHIGVAVDTPNGLVVPVFRDVDQKGIFELAAEMADVSVRARDGKLKSNDLQGGCMSISSLGGIGGTAFTPIVNAPEVAILGVSRAKMQPVWDGASFVPRLMLPLDLSYDHRVIDGAEAARFIVHLGGLLSDLRRLML